MIIETHSDVNWPITRMLPFLQAFFVVICTAASFPSFQASVYTYL